ncbi:Bacterial extracellular solute-binding protein, family 3 [Pseudoalteromonas sp. P1-9]|uniref:substrate-binding periplasmic protein n=1 Tax=Pseudoalteromonas sp. P1-9 TaxID=1710354 RepID=UPI0006D5D6EC|nr:transporter substrate-binding domain-containing protein [Pseudoalteromonas sp. P1-9]KPV98499.1 Bacterial extracellular solute-binding protein, family 3 [Pseudoalteromonas sp. P1-9]
MIIKYYLRLRPLVALSFLLFCSAHLFAGDSQEVRILVDDDYPPYSYIENGKVKGIYIDFIRQVSRELAPNYHIRFLPLPWKRALMLMEQGKELAILPPYKHPETRPFISHYSEKIGLEEVVVLCHKNVRLVDYFSQNKNSKPLSLGINAGYILLNDKYSKAVKLGTILLESNKSTEHNVEKLLKRRIDCYINDKTSTLLVLKDALAQNDMPNNADFIVMETISSQSAHIGFSKEYVQHFTDFESFLAELNNAIKQISNQQRTTDSVDQ